MNGRIHLHSINTQYGNVGQGRREMIVRDNKTREAVGGNGQDFVYIKGVFVKYIILF